MDQCGSMRAVSRMAGYPRVSLSECLPKGTKGQCDLLRSLDWVQETLVMVGDMDTHRDVYTCPPPCAAKSWQ